MVRRPQLALSLVLLLTLATFATGCGQKATDGYSGPRGTVSGRLMIDGTPLEEGCGVMFQSVEGGKIAVATVKSEGKYTLTCNGSFDIPAVNYRVQLSPPSDVKETKSSEPQDPTMMARKVMGPPGSATVSEKANPPFPAKYLSTRSSKLEYTVKAGPNTADFDLTP